MAWLKKFCIKLLRKLPDPLLLVLGNTLGSMFSRMRLCFCVLSLAVWAGAGLLLGAVLMYFLLSMLAGEAKATEIIIPKAAYTHKSTLIRCARAEGGLNAPTALFAAQVHQESCWREKAVSPVGAQGLAQFMPSTARWLPEVAPHTGAPMPFNPGWALRAMIAYDYWLYERVPPANTNCDRWAFVLSSYNGGLGWLKKDVRLASTSTSLSHAPTKWWGHVEVLNAGRSKAAS